MSKEIIAVTEIKREKGFIYPTGTDEKGNLTIMKVTAGRKKKEEVKPSETKEEEVEEQLVEAVAQ